MGEEDVAHEIVLILVLMEDGLWRGPVASWMKSWDTVLILVLMEDGLWLETLYTPTILSWGLNPCFNGRWSLTCFFLVASDGAEIGLNPCFNGRWSLTLFLSMKTDSFKVLILVLMEDGLWQLAEPRFPANLEKCLNPCFNGRWSLTIKNNMANNQIKTKS